MASRGAKQRLEHGGSAAQNVQQEVSHKVLIADRNSQSLLVCHIMEIVVLPVLRYRRVRKPDGGHHRGHAQGYTIRDHVRDLPWLAVDAPKWDDGHPCTQALPSTATQLDYCHCKWKCESLNSWKRADGSNANVVDGWVQVTTMLWTTLSLATFVTSL